MEISRKNLDMILMGKKIIGESESSKLFPKFQKSRNKNSDRFFRTTALKSSFFCSKQINRKVINRVFENFQGISILDKSGRAYLE